MTGFIELGAVALAVAGSTSRSLCGIGQHNTQSKTLRWAAKAATGQASRHHGKRHHLDPPHRKQHIESPLRSEDVAVCVGVDGGPNRRALGKQVVEFNGEIVAISADNGTSEPLVALGACTISCGASESQVIIAPPGVPTMELLFDNEKEAQAWAKEFREASLLKAPHHRIQELIVHGARVEKYLVSLRKRVQEVRKMEHKQTELLATLRKRERLDAAPSEDNLGPTTPSAMTMVRNSSLGSLLLPRSPSKESMSRSASLQDMFMVDQLNEQLQQHKDGHAEAEALAASLKSKLADHVPPEAHRRVHAQMQQHKQEKADANEEAARLRRKRDELIHMANEANAEVARQHMVSDPRRVLQELEVKREILVKDFEQRSHDVESQLAISRQNLREEQRRADSAAVRLQRLKQDREALLAQIDECECKRMVEAPPQDPQTRQLHRAVQDMQQSFEERMEAQQMDCANQLEKLEQKHTLDIAFLKSGLIGALSRQSLGASSVHPSSSILDTNGSEMSDMLRDLVEENLSLNARVAEKARILEAVRSSEKLNSSASCQSTFLLQTPTRQEFRSIYPKPFIDRTGSGGTPNIRTTMAHTVPSSPESDLGRVQRVSRRISTPLQTPMVSPEAQQRQASPINGRGSLVDAVTLSMKLLPPASGNSRSRLLSGVSSGSLGSGGVSERRLSGSSLARPTVSPVVRQVLLSGR